jgi:hypothetical protein
MSPAAAVVGSRSRILGRLPRRETREWATVVARYTRDDWPPPEWLPVMAEGGSDPREAPGAPMLAEEHAAA